MPTNPPYTYQRPNQSVYYFRIRVPNELQIIVGKHQYRHCLKTGYKRTAKNRALSLYSFYQSFFDEVKSMNPDEFNTVIQERLLKRLKDTLLSWEIDHAVQPRKTIDDINTQISNTNNVLIEEKINLKSGRYWEKKDESIALAEKLNIDFGNNEELVKLFCHVRTKYDIKYLEILLKRLEGDYDSENEILKSLQSNIPTRHKYNNNQAIRTGKRLSSIIDMYLQVNEHSWKQTTIKDYFNYTSWFLEIVGDIYIEDINHEIINNFVDTLKKLPVHRNKKSEYKNKNIKELVSLKCKNTISSRTIKNIVEHISSFFAWSISRGYMDTNYCKGKYRYKKENKTKFEPYTEEELRRILLSDYYLKSEFNKEYQYWLPLLGCYTGTRINELAQLQAKDVIFNDNVAHIVITASGENQKVKTEAGERRIPLHEIILKLGFEEYINRTTKNENDQIFPELIYRNHSFGANASRWYSCYINTLGIKPNKEGYKKTFHSWRSTFAMICKMQDMPVRQVHEIIGHHDKDMTMDYYATAYPVDKLYTDVISKLDFRIDITPLTRTEYFSNFLK